MQKNFLYSFICTFNFYTVLELFEQMKQGHESVGNDGALKVVSAGEPNAMKLA